MGLLGRALLAALVGICSACYAPELRDCTVACSSKHDCADEQVCGSDKLCASVQVAGRCAMVAGDAGIPGTGVAGNDASVDAPPDAPTHGAIAFALSGKGHVIVQNHGTCDSDAPQEGRCVFKVPLEISVTVQAVADDDYEFIEWSTSACPDANSPTCSFVPALVMEIGVRFRKDD